jgi:hypothetical protein
MIIGLPRSNRQPDDLYHLVWQFLMAQTVCPVTGACTSRAWPNCPVAPADRTFSDPFRKLLVIPYRLFMVNSQLFDALDAHDLFICAVIHALLFPKMGAEVQHSKSFTFVREI